VSTIFRLQKNYLYPKSKKTEMSQEEANLVTRLSPLPPLSNTGSVAAGTLMRGYVGCEPNAIANELFRKITHFLSETGRCFVSGAFVIEDPKSEIMEHFNRCKPIDGHKRSKGAVTHSAFKETSFAGRKSNSPEYATLFRHFRGDSARFTRVFHTKFNTLLNPGEQMLEYKLNNDHDIDMRCDTIYRGTDGQLHHYHEDFLKKTMNFYPFYVVDENNYASVARFRSGDRVCFQGNTVVTRKNIFGYETRTTEMRHVFGTVNNPPTSGGFVNIMRDDNNMVEQIVAVRVFGLYEFVYVKLETSGTGLAELPAHLHSAYRKYIRHDPILKTRVFLPQRAEDELTLTNEKIREFERNDIEAIEASGNMMTDQDKTDAVQMTKLYNQFIRSSGERFIPAALFRTIMKGPREWKSTTDPRTVQWEAIDASTTPPVLDQGQELRTRTALLDATNNNASFGSRRQRKRIVSLKEFVRKYHGSPSKAIKKYQLAMRLMASA
jgi:hypothetical protein